MKRGFALSIIAGTIFAALLALAAFQLALNSLQTAGLEEFRLTRAAERWSDALAYLNSTLTDAALDAAYLAAGCDKPWDGDVCGNLTAILPSYYSNSSLNASDFLVSVNASAALSCTEVAAELGYNRTFNANIVSTITANSSNAVKTGYFNATRFVDVNRSAETLTIRVREAGELLRVNVNCSA